VIAAEVDATLVNMRFVKPLDEELILELARTHKAFVTIEDNAIAGGAGTAVAECLAANGITLPIQHLGLPDVYLEHGSREEVLTMAGLDLPQIRNAIRARFPQYVDTPVASAG
jgi:1-deoxy-D-xylulose-5-phosphate synthase